MQKRISESKWKFSYNTSHKRLSLKARFKMGFEELFGYRLWEYKNYTLLK
jgi:hypothetical protein